ncbi:hypothetical protein FOA52_009327 [Chlamydomonas sp. UWO 241]|nr:hypothetical protein FOA52_009327 [Chlamydomonas sp. UWO 241]
MAAASSGPMDEGDWANIVDHLESYDAQREGVVKQARELQKKAKQAVHLMQRGVREGDAGTGGGGEHDVQAAVLLSEAEAIATGMLPALKQHPGMRGAVAFAMEELAQAVLFRTFLQQGRLAPSRELPLCEPEEYLSGVLDFTAELGRYTIQRATARDTAAVRRCRDLVDALQGQFLQFDLRNSGLRRKYDGLKYRLKELENTMYELSLTQAMPVATAEGGGMAS